MLSEAEKKFWGCPKLIENLLPFLDTYSIICLAQVDAPSQIPCTILNTKFAIPKPSTVSLPGLQLHLHCSGLQACPGRHPG